MSLYSTSCTLPKIIHVNSSYFMLIHILLSAKNLGPSHDVGRSLQLMDGLIGREKQKHILWALPQNMFFLSPSSSPSTVIDGPQYAKEHHDPPSRDGTNLLPLHIT